ncbi:MAG: Rrf2 family transcriptional regulator [Candidatus Eremiobacteraeota bacterium]|nr:Rrf2 family transcriptional regulator [Candidatus Eremiobacteraeota bacterium]
MAANSRFAVAVHAAAAIAYQGARGEGWVSSEQLAGSVRTNPVVVRRVVTALVRAGLLESQHGRGGGARLARRPEDLTLREIYHAVAGASDRGVDILAYNPNPANSACRVSCGMRDALAPVFTAVETAVDDALGRTTLADVLARLAAVDRAPHVDHLTTA